MSHHIHEDIWYEKKWWAVGEFGFCKTEFTGKTKIVRYVKVGLDQAQVLHKAGVTVYKWAKARRLGHVGTRFATTQDTWWTSYHLELCRAKELIRLHANDVHHNTLAAIQRGTVSYCVLVED